MKNRKWIQIIAMLLCAVLMLSACKEEGGSGEEEKTASNTYETPVEIEINEANLKNFRSRQDLILESLNGLFADEIRAVYDILEKADTYADDLEEERDDFEDRKEDFEDDYGDDWKYSYKIEDKDEIKEEERVGAYKEMLNISSSMEDHIAEVEAYDPYEWETYANRLHLSVEDAKALVKALGKLGEAIYDAQITEGYLLQMDITLDSDKLDEPEQQDYDLKVYNVDGRWVSWHAINDLWYFVDMVR